MKLQIYSLLLVVSAAVAIAPPVHATEAEISIPPTPLFKGGNLLSPTPQNTAAKSNLLSLTPLFKGGAAGGGIWGSLAQSRITQVTAVQLQQTDKGLEVILETPDGESLQVFPTSFSKTFVANIPNAQLAQNKTFRQENPASGIASVAVTQQGTNNIRVTVTGTQDLPKIEVGRSNRALTLTLPEAIAPTAQQPTPEAPVPTPETQTTPEVTPPADETTPPDGLQPPAATTEGDEEVEIVVTGEGETGYSVPDTSTATKTDTPLRDIPQSIQVIPRQLLEDRNITRVGEALQNVPGVFSLEGGYEGYADYYQIRGFDTSRGSIFRDGIATDVWDTSETVNLERIEVLKGPASVLFGQGSPGGIVNLVTKKPLAEPYSSISGTIGSFDTYRGELDFSGPLNDSKTVRYRLTMAYENNDSFIDFVEGERFFIAPVITWDIGSRTSLTVDASYTNDSRTPYYGIPAVGGRIADVPRSRYYGEPFAEYSRDGFELGAVLRHGFSDNWSVTGAFRYISYSPERYAVFFSSPDEDTGEMTREQYFSDGNYQRYIGNLDLVGEFKTGSIQHKLLLGTEYRQYIEDPRFQFGEYPSINLFDPVYVNRRFDKAPTFFRDDYDETWGFYIQDQIELLPNLKFLAGVRYDNYQQNRTTQDLGEPRIDFEQTDTAWSPRVGIVYQPIEPISLYFSYSESFVPNFGDTLDQADEPFDPEKGRQFEVGLKADLNPNLNATLALFDIRKQNVLTTDPINPEFSIQTGEQTSKGIELGIAGEILPGWDIYASYTYLDAYISEDNTYEVGNRLPNVPESTIGLWTKYEIQQGGLRGLGFGLGLYYVGDRFGELDNTVELPSYFRTDLALFYERDNWKAQINFKNLFDIDYEAGTSGGTSITPGAPFTVSGTLSVEF
ncbi:TonB-dependent siderophore receptor [Chroococcidiopsidales cyanobacterium LEGE 13417]|nr:TonB-dependent siderophore receptor [Chroococcidiopsidales cyanobacterium LEGE 13417]